MKGLLDSFLSNNEDLSSALSTANEYLNTNKDAINNIKNKISKSVDIPEIIGDVLSLITQSPTDIFMPCELKATECNHSQRLLETLRKYHIYTQKQLDDDHKNDIYHTVFDDEHKLVDALNGYQHLLFRHKDEFEDIYTTINQCIYHNKGCNVSKCNVLKRNRRDRSLITNNDVLNGLYHGTDIMEQQFMDIIHCYFMHSFDSGYRLCTKTRELLISEETKTNDETSATHQSIRKLLTLKRDSNANSRAVNTKFNTATYSYGFRFYYHDYYKNNKNTYDDAAPISIQNHKDNEITTDDAVCEMYITPMHSDFQEELLNNTLCAISKYQWDNEWQNVLQYVQLDIARDMQCLRETNGSGKCYGMKKGDKIQLNHLMALKLYTDYDNLQNEFSATFRLKDDDTMEDLKKRHQNYYFWGKYLRECIECFGMRCGNKKTFTVYHGVMQQMAFSSVYPYIKGPFSTTQDYAVAVQFCNGTGMILELEINVNEWKQKLHIERTNYMECNWISNHPHEQEILFFGGINRHIFSTIIDAKLNVNYAIYVKALRQMTYCTTNWNVSMDIFNDQRPKSIKERQLVCRLMSHELYRYEQLRNISRKNKADQRLANEWMHKEAKYDYIKKMVHEHCMHIKAIAFYDTLFFKDKRENLIFEQFFQMDNGWVTLDRITTVFPNLEVIALNIEDPKVMKQAFDTSVLPFIKDKKQGSLKIIGVRMKSEDKHEMEQIKNVYVETFSKYGWRLKVRDIEFDKWITEIDVDLGALSSELGGNLVEIISALKLGDNVSESINRIRERIGIEIEIKKMKKSIDH